MTRLRELRSARSQRQTGGLECFMSIAAAFPQWSVREEEASVKRRPRVRIRWIGTSDKEFWGCRHRNQMQCRKTKRRGQEEVGVVVWQPNETRRCSGDDGQSKLSSDLQVQLLGRERERAAGKQAKLPAVLLGSCSDDRVPRPKLTLDPDGSRPIRRRDSSHQHDIMLCLGAMPVSAVRIHYRMRLICTASPACLLTRDDVNIPGSLSSSIISLF